jgi:hypothetical protein
MRPVKSGQAAERNRFHAPQHDKDMLCFASMGFEIMMPAEQYEDEAHAAFCRYAEAKLRVEQTMDFKDAMVAGRAWAAFLNKFLENPADHLPTTADVIRFPRGKQ